jgi:AraC family transcriptional regulator
MARTEANLLYDAGVNRAIDYITAHYDGRIDLHTLAGVALFSPWHFHRVFKAVTGETPQAYLTRIRLEQAVLLMDGIQSLTDIALTTGFSTPSHFALAFKKRYRLSPRRYRVQRRDKKRKIMTVSTGRRAHTAEHALPEFRIAGCPAYRIAYVRHTGNYDVRIGAAWRTLMQWARQHGLVSADSLRLSFSYDVPELTPDGKLRYDACLTVPDGTVPEGRVGVRGIAGGMFAVFVYRGRTGGLGSFYEDAYASLARSCRRRPGDRPAYAVHGESKADQIRGRLDMEIRIPLEG